MRRLLLWLGSIIVIGMLGGCTERNTVIPMGSIDKSYQMIEENGDLYLDMDEVVSVETTDNVNSIMKPHLLYFDSLDEMINDFNTGNLNEEELAELSYFPKDEQGRVKVYSKDDLYIPIVPVPIEIKTVLLYPDGISYLLKSGGKYNHIMQLITQEYYLKRVSDEKNILDRLTIPVHSVEYDEERNATVIHLTDLIGTEKKYSYYEVEGRNKALYIKERYILSESKDIPECIWIWGVDGDTYFSVTLNSLTERPSVEWLSQFGIREYVETEVT